MQAKAFLLPDLGEGLHEAEIVEWHVAEGDEVEADAPLVSVETDKAVVEVPAPWSGRIGRLCAKVGETVAVGAPVIEYAGTGEPGTTRATAVDSRRASQPHKASVAKPESDRSAERPRAMPAVRLLARELGLSLDGMAGTGPGGAISARDVAVAFKASVGVGPSTSAGLALGGASDGWEPLKGARRSMAEAMTRARDVVPATVTDEVDIGDWPDAAGLVPRLIRAIGRGVAAESSLNAWFDPVSGRRLFGAVHLGLAVDTPTGLIVPVVHDACTLAPEALGSEIARLIEGARTRSLAPEDLKGATLTLSNFGSLAGRHATPVVVPPQVAILGVGRMRKVVRLANGRPVERPVLPLSLTIDHRAVTGGESARFLAAVMEDLALSG
ncbi:MAG: dihydrolipoamide acetyltransferase family protein [Hyphomicrobiaceae bacterium]